MEELLELKKLLLNGDIKGSLVIVEELEEMGKSSIIDNISSWAEILLLYLIKQQAENRTTRSWEVYIRNSVRKIERKNKRRTGGYYLNPEELFATLKTAYVTAIDAAALEVEEGRYYPEELEQLINKQEILNRAFELISPLEEIL